MIGEAKREQEAFENDPWRVAAFEFQMFLIRAKFDAILSDAEPGEINRRAEAMAHLDYESWLNASSQ